MCGISTVGVACCLRSIVRKEWKEFGYVGIGAVPNYETWYFVMNRPNSRIPQLGRERCKHGRTDQAGNA